MLNVYIILNALNRRSFNYLLAYYYTYYNNYNRTNNTIYIIELVIVLFHNIIVYTITIHNH